MAVEMRLSIRITIIAMVLWQVGCADTGAAAAATAGSPPDVLKPDMKSAAQLSLSQAQDILRPWILGYTPAGNVVFKGGTVNGGAFAIAMDHESTAQRRENAPGVWYQLELGDGPSAWTGLMTSDTAEQVLNALKRWQMSSAAERQGWEAQKAQEFAAIAALSAFTPAAGPSGWFQMQPTTARKSVPARTRGPLFSGVMPPMAHDGSSIISDHQARISGSSKFVTSFVVDAKNAPNAT